jgi:hypothetical protein
MVIRQKLVKRELYKGIRQEGIVGEDEKYRKAKAGFLCRSPAFAYKIAILPN